MMEGDTFGFMLVFGLSSRCNLQCTYCNANAGPDGVRPTLDPRLVEGWVEAFASLDPAYMAVQLHGGEPLLVDPPVEAYGAIVRNMMARFPRTALGYLGFQSNGAALTPRRIGEIDAVGLSMDVSIDGPAWIHDPQRPARRRSRHAAAVGAPRLLPAPARPAGVVSVNTDPAHVVPAVEYFIENGFGDVRMNVIRPEGRAKYLPHAGETSMMEEMARQYFRAAQRIAAHNEAHPEAPFYEYNLSSLMRILLGEERETEMVYWSFLIDHRGRLWSHHCVFYGEGNQLTDGEARSIALVRQELGLDGVPALSRAAVAGAIRQRLDQNAFTACADCKSPGFCVPVYGRRSEAEPRNPVCVWTSSLTAYLAAWLREDPAAARRTVPGAGPQAEAGIGAVAVAA